MRSMANSNTAHPVQEVIDVGYRITHALEKDTNQECQDIHSFVQTLLTTDLRLLRQAPKKIMDDDPSILKSLKDFLKSKLEIAKKREADRAGALKANDIASKMNMMRLEIIQKLLSAQVVPGHSSTYSLLLQQVDVKITDQTSNKLDTIVKAIKALLVPLQCKVRSL